MNIGVELDEIPVVIGELRGCIMRERAHGPKSVQTPSDRMATNAALARVNKYIIDLERELEAAHQEINREQEQESAR